MRLFRNIILITLITFLIVWLSALAKCEYLTHKYHDDFKYGYVDTNMLGDMEYFKVLSCDGKYAEVYYVSENMTGANIISFVKIDDEWIYNSWATIWSTTGSASEVIWPYWWHFIYGGF